MNHKRVLFLVTFIAVITAAIEGQTSPEYKVLFEKAKFTMETKGDLNGAINLFNDIIKKYPKEREYAAKSQLYIGLCYEKLGNTEARKAYEVVVRDFADQAETTKLARERLNVLTIGTDISTNRTEVTMRRIWEGTKQPRGMSPDGRYLIISSGDIWLHDLKSGEEKQITHEASDVDWTFSTGAAAISPDGKRIVYDWYVRSYRELRISTLDGSSTKVLHSGQNGRDMYVCSWMPDNRRILAVSYSQNQNDQDFRLQIISLPDLTIHDIGQPDSKEIVGVSPSPEGRYIGYGRKGDIFIYDTITEQESVLVQNPSIDILAGWIPDGSGILFASDRSGTPDLYLLEIENGKPHGAPEMIKGNVVNSTDFYYAKFYLTKDGQLFQFKNTGTTKSFISQVEEQTGKLTGTQSLVDSNYPNVEGPGWSPDGKMLYYEIFKDPLNEQFLFIRSEATGQTHEITLKPKLEFWYNPILSPDGRRFAVSGTDKNNNFGIFTIDSESGLVSQVVNIPTENVAVDPCQNWSPDGKAIFYKVRSSEESEEFIIRRKDLTTGEEKDIFRGIHTRDMKISPDGTQFVYFRNDRPSKSYVLGILDIQSGKELELYRVTEADTTELSGPIWSHDSRYVLVARGLMHGTELLRFHVAGGPGEKLHLFPEYSYGFVLNPRGDRMAYTQSKMGSELWVLENFLPKEKMEENNQLTLSKLDYAELNTPFARISPDGRYVSYPDWNTGDLAIHNVVTGENRQLTNKGSWASSSDNAVYSLFSPDGKQVAYTWQIWSENQTELRIINKDGSQPRVIYKGHESWPMSWSPNGKFILARLLNKDKTWRPAIITVADSSIQDLEFRISGAMYISPEGKYVAYDSPQANDVKQRDVYLYELATKRILPLVKHPADDGLLGWAPDGKHLLFTSDRSGTQDAWMVTVSGGKIQGEPALVRKNIGEIEGIGFTQSGDFYFHESVGGHNIYTAKLDFDSGKLLSQPAETAGSYLGSNWRPDFSHDGRFMAYISNRGSGEDQGNTIVIRSLETGKERLLMPALEIGYGLRWVPDGNSLLVNGTDKTKKEGLFRVDAQTGEARLIVEHHFVGVPGLEISPDGNMIFYTAVAGSGIPEGEAAYNVKHYSLDLQAGQEKELAQPGNTPLVPIALSPDGKQLAFIGAGDKAGTVGICIMPVSGGPSKHLVNIGPIGWASRVIAWTPDGRYLIYGVMLTKPQNTDLGQTSWQLWRVSAEGGEPQPLDLKIDGLLRHFRIHPNGQQIVYYTWRGGTEAWVMKNFLPK
jgi:Tol biopolymer transport system component